MRPVTVSDCAAETTRLAKTAAADCHARIACVVIERTPEVRAAPARASNDVIRNLDEDTALTSLSIVPATPADVPTVNALIRELAEYEKLLHEVVATQELVHEALFGPRPVVECVLARVGTQSVGFALYFFNFSTFLARPGLYLEDLYVRPEHRGQGIGESLLKHLAQLAIQRGCGRMEWAALNWNRRAIDFYEKMGAVGVKEWTTFRVSGEALMRLGS